MTAPAVLVLAGLDPSGGAGLLADAEAIRAAGGRPLCIATALTVQTAKRALRFEPVSPALVAEQARALLEEEPVAAVKIGMLGTPAMARAAAAIASAARAPLVVDPVLRASSGASLFAAAPAELRAAYEPLLRLGAVITPNLAEARDLLGLRDEPSDPLAMASAARKLVSLGARAALVKGGHLAGDAIDILADATGTHELRAPRLPHSKRGTGCRLASTLATQLALGLPLLTAAKEAKEAVRRYLAE